MKSQISGFSALETEDGSPKTEDPEK